MRERALSRRVQDLEQVPDALLPLGVGLDDERRAKICEGSLTVSPKLLLEAAGRQRNRVERQRSRSRRSRDARYLLRRSVQWRSC
jgi:hypothetical protein